MIEAPLTEESEAAEGSEVETHTNSGRARWKAIYLSALLFKLLPGDQREGPKERLRVKVRELLRSGALSPADDCHHCLQPLSMDLPEPRVNQRKQAYTVFETWILTLPWTGRFPLLPLAEVPGRKLGQGTLQAI